MTTPRVERTPDEIKQLQSQVTREQVNELAKALIFLLPPEKRVFQTLVEARKHGMKPDEQAKMLLGSAYDWFAYGN